LDKKLYLFQKNIKGDQRFELFRIFFSIYSLKIDFRALLRCRKYKLYLQ